MDTETSDMDEREAPAATEYRLVLSTGAGVSDGDARFAKRMQPCLPRREADLPLVSMKKGLMSSNGR